jgi:antitoxin ChpS
MYKTRLKKVGGSQMLAVPPALIQAMGYQPGAEIEIEIDGDRLVLGAPRQRKNLSDLLALCSPAEISSEDQEWLNDGPVGEELI